MEFEIWERDGNGELVHKDDTVVIDEPQILDEIENIKAEDCSEEEKEINQAVIEKLQKYYEENKRELEISYIPILKFEASNILRKPVDGKHIGLDGKPVEDLDAQICAQKCMKPNYSYEEWRDMKDGSIKFHIAKFIYEKSFPKGESKKKAKKELKEAMNLLRKKKDTKTEASLDTSSAKLDTASSSKED